MEWQLTRGTFLRRHTTAESRSRGPDILRAGVANEVDRESDEIVRGREARLGVGEVALFLSGLRAALVGAGASSSVHCK